MRPRRAPAGAAPVRLVTVAAEVPGALELIAELRAAGVVVAVGHSDASAAQARAAFDRRGRGGHPPVERPAPAHRPRSPAWWAPPS